MLLSACCLLLAYGALDRAVVLSPLRVQNILWSLKIQAQVVERKFATKICLAERKSGSLGLVTDKKRRRRRRRRTRKKNKGLEHSRKM